MKNYYGRHLLARETWSRLFRGQVKIAQAVLSLIRNLRGSLTTEKMERSGTPNLSFVDRMLTGLLQFDGNVLLILSGQDLTAAEFVDLCSRARSWRRVMDSPRVQRIDIPAADHTFSSQQWRTEVETITSNWIAEL
jgi:hypothetical protein